MNAAALRRAADAIFAGRFHFGPPVEVGRAVLA